MIPWSLVVFLLILAWAFWTFMRRRTPSKPNLGIVIGILHNISYNQKLIEARMSNNQTGKKFKIYNWKTNKEKMEFLDPELVTKINETFSLTIDFNSRIDSARKNKNQSPLTGWELETLKTALAGIKMSLITWLKDDLENENADKKGRGFFGS